jgi:SAM-dependent methyltransferase
MADFFSPEWIDEVLSKYDSPLRKQGEEGMIDHSHFGRHATLNQFRTMYCRSLDKRGPNILYVGTGTDNPAERLCASGPFEIAALLENMCFFDYRMTLIDINKRNLETAQKRDEIFTHEPTAEWKAYLQRTAQCKEIKSKPDEISLSAKIPETFRRKRSEGEIKFTVGDAVTTDFRQHEPFDMIECFNVLCYIDKQHKDATLLALYNLVSALQPGGILLIDDVRFYDMYDYTPTHGTFIRDRIKQVRVLPIDLICEEMGATRADRYLVYRKRN